jgi:hypothetical protein
MKNFATRTSLDEVSIGPEAGKEEPGSRCFVRLTDLLPRGNSPDGPKYSSGFRNGLQGPAVNAFERGEAPELLEATRAAHAATYHIKNKPDVQQDIVEEAVAEALTQYVRCCCGNIRSTCPQCVVNVNGEPPAESLRLLFSIEGLKKLATRVTERLKKQEHRREYPQPKLDEQEADARVLGGDIRQSATRPIWNRAREVEDDMIAMLDAKRGYFDLSNGRLWRFLAKAFRKKELAKLVNNLDRPDVLAQRFREGWDALVYFR